MTSPAERALAHVRALFPSPGPDQLGPLLAATPVTVHFHPDRLLADHRTVAEHLAAEGTYRSQFETRISNGGLTAHPGGDRDRWEQRMFPGAYPVTAGRPTTTGRPVYGALNLARHPDGAAPRFGSCHLVLHPHVLTRTTLSLDDSVTEPTIVGTAATFGAIWDGLLARVADTGRALALTAPSPQEWTTALTAGRTATGRALDEYIEAQIHGGLTLSHDVAAIVCDPSLRDTPSVAALHTLGAPVLYHPGFQLPADEFPADLRGPQAPLLAAALASRYDAPLLDAAALGRAAQSVVRSPHEWSSFGAPAEVLQLLKYLWHILVLRGRPVPPAREEV
ncbi:DUF3626 domain-containing protein [Actinoplanes sp. NBRC 101535]|uniref:DUF3626 domain-containing protein n=1 Tax=Actinoplanes sp. NBRC 101535 TaxID=3032196 RepID=UPI0024A581E1|nr:DUF3626 domain-containing protein [Actinoplanes sp. NBRC 101535]GLY03014.1 hypothetical protein Acsp01_33930 [Actinoplanes sp. NBRC 101535]